jgi:SAM-dependent methyltransferase
MDLSANIEKVNGIWYAKNQSPISFPETGYDHCLQIEENSFWFKHRNECIVSLVKQFSPQTTFFDIGGDNGYVSLGLEKAGIPTVLVEPGEQGAFNAQQRKLSNIVCSTLADAHFIPNSLGAVGAFDVIEHIEKDEEFVKMLHNYLQPSGKLYATVPAFNWLWSIEYAGHYRRYNMKNFTELLQKAGFKLCYTTYIFSVLPLPIFLLRAIPTKLGMKQQHNVATNESEHSAGQEGMAAKLLNKLWSWELQKVQTLSPIGFGGSILVVAEK